MGWTEVIKPFLSSTFVLLVVLVSVLAFPVVALAYGPWIIWLMLVFWLAWRVPMLIAPDKSTLKVVGRRFALGAVVITAFSVPFIYLIATLQTSVFGGDGFAWAEASVVPAVIFLLSPQIYVPLLAVRLFLLWRRERDMDAVA